MTISHGPVWRLALGFIIITAIVAGGGWYAVRRVDTATAASAELARAQLPVVAAATNVERLALRALSTEVRDRESVWYLEKAVEALDQALVTLDATGSEIQRDSARETQGSLLRYADVVVEFKAAQGVISQAHDGALEKLAATEAAAEEARQTWDALEPAEQAEFAGVGLAAVWKAREDMAAAARMVTRAAAEGRAGHAEDALWRVQAARRVLLMENGEAPPANDEAQEAEGWAGALQRLRASVVEADAAIEAVRAAAAVLTEARGEVAAAEDALWQAVQRFTRSGLTTAESQAVGLASDLDTLSRVWVLALAVLVVATLAIGLITVASTGRSLEEANLPLLCQCGKLNAPTARFCGRCGQEFSG